MQRRRCRWIHGEKWNCNPAAWWCTTIRAESRTDIQLASGGIGDEFTLDGSQRIINQIQFEYFAALNPFKSDQKGVLHFYANNGPLTGEGGSKKPGDLLFESDAFSLRAGYNMVTVSDLLVRVPEEITSVTWALEFSGLTNIGKVGLLLHDEPDKGASAGTFWLNAGTKAAPDWQLQTPANGVEISPPVLPLKLRHR